jgi:hypothetical protein
MDRENQFFDAYVKHLPQAGPEVIGRPGVHHLVMHHDQDCRIYSGGQCSCDPQISFYSEPERV